MENPVGISRIIGLNPVSDVHTYSTSTPTGQLHQPVPDEYNQFNLQNINAPTSPKWKNNENILEDFKKFKRVACAFLMALWHTLPMVRSKQTCF